MDDKMVRNQVSTIRPKIETVKDTEKGQQTKDYHLLRCFIDGECAGFVGYTMFRVN